MRHPLRVIAFACVLACTPACAALPKIENPFAVTQSADQQAYALLSSYAAVLEEATDVVRDPATPPSVRRAMGLAERAATPAIETLEIAVSAYLRAKSDLAAAGGNQSALEGASTALTIAARRLGEAIDAAKAPVSELQALVRAH
jgi:hypothetical protein